MDKIFVGVIKVKHVNFCLYTTGMMISESSDSDTCHYHSDPVLYPKMFGFIPLMSETYTYTDTQFIYVILVDQCFCGIVQ